MAIDAVMNRSSIEMIENTESLLMLTNWTTQEAGVRVHWTGLRCELNTCLKDFLSASIISSSNITSELFDVKVKILKQKGIKSGPFG